MHEKNTIDTGVCVCVCVTLYNCGRNQVNLCGRFRPLVLYCTGHRRNLWLALTETFGSAELPTENQ